MRLALLLVVLAACEHPPVPSPAVRTHDELVRAVTAFAALVHGGTLPAVDDARFTRPPSDAEMAWIVDRQQPLSARVEQALAFFDEMRTVIHGYVDRDKAASRDSPEATVWMTSMFVGYADLVDVMIDEFLPTVPHDDKYQTRMQGLRQVEAGGVEMLHGSLLTVAARKLDGAVRLQMLTTWHAHAASYRKVWSAADCSTLAAEVAAIQKSERDAAIAKALQDLAGDLRDCKGAIP